MIYTLRAARTAAALATVSCILCNARTPAWSGVASLTEQFPALIQALCMCALFFWVRDCLPKSNRTSLVWRRYFLLGALCDMLLVSEHIDGMTGQNKAGIDSGRAADEPTRATVALVEGIVQE